ncbi:MAG: hypothetical protein GY810_11370 [Aureispira sp.]|nr:hypothetical protein [Aureispira sp.]
MEIISFKDLSSFQTATRNDLKKLDELVKIKEKVIVINELYATKLDENNRLIKVYGNHDNALQKKFSGTKITSALYHIHNNRAIAFNQYKDDNKSFDVYNNEFKQKETYSVNFLKGRELAAVAIDDKHAYIYLFNKMLYAFRLDEDGGLSYLNDKK